MACLQRFLGRLLGAGFFQADRGTQELKAEVNPAVCPWLAITHFGRLREFTRQRGNQRLFAKLPEPVGHHPSAVGADVTRERFFGDTRFRRCYQAHGYRHRSALFNSSVEKHSTKIRRWSEVVHSSLGSPHRNGPFLSQFFILLPLSV